jgi:hypothetical protein
MGKWAFGVGGRSGCLAWLARLGIEWGFLGEERGIRYLTHGPGTPDCRGRRRAAESGREQSGGTPACSWSEMLISKSDLCTPATKEETLILLDPHKYPEFIIHRCIWSCRVTRYKRHECNTLLEERPLAKASSPDLLGCHKLSRPGRLT